jgi:hypothetical protein
MPLALLPASRDWPWGAVHRGLLGLSSAGSHGGKAGPPMPSGRAARFPMPRGLGRAYWYGLSTMSSALQSRVEDGPICMPCSTA